MRSENGGVRGWVLARKGSAERPRGRGEEGIRGWGLGCVERFKGGKEVHGCSEEAGYA